MNEDLVFKLRASGLIGRAAAYLLLNLAFLGKAVAEKVQSKEVELFDGEVIHTFTASSAGTGLVKVLGNDSTQSVGISDFRQGELTGDRGVCFDRVELHYAGSNAADISKTGVYTPHMWEMDGTARFPGNFLNGIFRLYVNNKPVIEKNVSELVNMGREYQGQNVFGEVSIPKVIPPGVPVRAEIELPAGTAVGGANTHYFKLKFKGAVVGTTPGK